MSKIENSSILDLYALSLKEDNYPPIAGKILGLFYISDKKFFSFEELMEQLKVSKGAISKGLKMLMEQGEVSYEIFPENKRKRFFYLDTKGSIERMQRLVDAYFMHTQLLEETLKIRTKENQELNQFIKTSIEFNKEVLDFFDKKIEEHFLKG